MRDIGSEMVDGRAYYFCTFDPGDTVEAVCLYFGYSDWRSTYRLPPNESFREAYPDPAQIQFDPTSENPRFYIPNRTGASGQHSIAHLGPLETFCRQIAVLERAETNADRLVTYIRKIFPYDSAGWDAIIPQARDVDMPASMSQRPDIELAVRYIREHQVLPVDGRDVDIGHFFAGLDARNHPERPSRLGPSIRNIEQRLGIRLDIDELRSRLGSDLNITRDTSVPILVIRDNQRVATWSPDIGSAVVEYIHSTLGSGRPFSYYYDNWASIQDMRGNADSYVSPFDSSQRLSQQFRSYYMGTSSQRRQRFAQFRQRIGMQNTDAWKNPVRKDVLNSALGYAQIQGYNTDVAYILANRAIGSGVSRSVLDFFTGGAGSRALNAWEQLYRTACSLGVELFIQQMTSNTF